jgi:hypothetical protein
MEELLLQLVMMGVMLLGHTMIQSDGREWVAEATEEAGKAYTRVDAGHNRVDDADSDSALLLNTMILVVVGCSGCSGGYLEKAALLVMATRALTKEKEMKKKKSVVTDSNC